MIIRARAGTYAQQGCWAFELTSPSVRELLRLLVAVANSPPTGSNLRQRQVSLKYAPSNHAAARAVIPPLLARASALALLTGALQLAK